jgi:pilus assembly protein Flp/PilA
MMIPMYLIARLDTLCRAFHGFPLRLRARDDERGQGMVEYAFILVLIAIVVVVVLSVMGAQVKNVFSNVSSGLGT